MSRKRTLGSALLLLPVLLFSVGCGILTTEAGRPESARVVLSQADGLPLRLDTSLNFIVTQSQELNFQELSVDTVTVPFEKDYDIRQYLRFYVRATNIQPETVTVRMRVNIDGESWYNEMKTLATDETAQFVYRYREPAIF
jgi:hypothetical protein